MHQWCRRIKVRNFAASLTNGPLIRNPFFAGLTTPGGRYIHGSLQTAQIISFSRLPSAQPALRPAFAGITVCGTLLRKLIFDLDGEALTQ
jgi:hypothetical protein